MCEINRTKQPRANSVIVPRSTRFALLVGVGTGTSHLGDTKVASPSIITTLLRPSFSHRAAMSSRDAARRVTSPRDKLARLLQSVA